MSIGYGWILLFEIIFLMPPSGAFAQVEVLDRVVAVVNGEIIALSDIRTEKAMRNILGEPTAKNDRELLNELINRRIIQTYLRQYPQANPTEAEIDEELAQIKNNKGLPTEAIRDAIRERLRVEYFFRERFAQSIIATDAEIQKYYEEVFVPAARAWRSCHSVSITGDRTDSRERPQGEIGRGSEVVARARTENRKH
jgi:parvulin-like peptidyl-prolyl isomerase